MRYQTAVVTGASRGLGRAIARVLAGRGLNVMLAARAGDELAATVRELDAQFPGRAAATVTDLRQPAEIRALFGAARERFGPVDVLVNNAGIGWYKPLLDWTEAEVLDTVAVNLSAFMLASQAVLPDMMAARRGLIVSIASDLSRRYLPHMAPYVATKFGALGFAGSLLREVKPHGIKVCSILPGLIDSNFNNKAEGTREEPRALRPAVLAEAVGTLLDQPEHVVMDELVIHPLQQDF